MTQDDKKRAVAAAAVELVEPGIVLGVGTGSTTNCFIDALAPLADKIDGAVSSSEASTGRLAALGVRLLDLNEIDRIPLYVDGADEATDARHLVKGGGGALTREKIVAAASDRFVCIIDDSKWVGALGKFPLPVEIVPMARTYVSRQFVKSRGQPVLRKNYLTDNGNEVLDIYNLNITNPVEMENRFNQIPGVVTVGIFAQRPADRIFMADDNGVHEMHRA